MIEAGRFVSPFRLVHVSADDHVLADFPMGTDLREFILAPGETIMLRDSFDRDYLVVAAQR